MTLKVDIEQLENEIKGKKRLLEILHEENEVLKEKVQMDKEWNVELEKNVQKTNHSISLSEEFSKIEIVFTCELCAEEFRQKNDLNDQ